MLGGTQDKRGALTGSVSDEQMQAHTLIGDGAQFSGKLTFEGTVKIDGRFEGEISTTGVLLVGSNAEVRATLSVGSVVISGLVEGDVTATQGVELRAPGHLKGNVTTPELVMDKGVLFNGSCTMVRAGEAISVDSQRDSDTSA